MLQKICWELSSITNVFQKQYNKMGWLLMFFFVFFFRILLSILVVTRIYCPSSFFPQKKPFPKYLVPSLMFSLILWKSYCCRSYQCPDWSQNLLGLSLDDYQSQHCWELYNYCIQLFYVYFLPFVKFLVIY